MHRPPSTAVDALPARLGAFVLERFPFACAAAMEALAAIDLADARGEAAIDALRARLATLLPPALPTPLPQVSARGLTGSSEPVCRC